MKGQGASPALGLHGGCAVSSVKQGHLIQLHMSFRSCAIRLVSWRMLFVLDLPSTSSHLSFNSLSWVFREFTVESSPDSLVPLSVHGAPAQAWSGHGYSTVVVKAQLYSPALVLPKSSQVNSR